MFFYFQNTKWIVNIFQEQGFNDNTYNSTKLYKRDSQNPGRLRTNKPTFSLKNVWQMITFDNIS